MILALLDEAGVSWSPSYTHNHLAQKLQDYQYSEAMCIYNASDAIDVSKVFETQDVCHFTMLSF